MLVAGEASGDRHAASLFLELKKRLPDVRGIGMGGRKMAEAGIDIRYDSSEIGVIGLVEVLKHYGDIRRALTSMQTVVCEEKPDLLICVDYKEFNFKLAKKAKACGVKVLFYVSPQVWAWRPGRVKKYGKVIDTMAVIFPFEVRYYEREGIPVRFVGHPLAEKVHPTETRQTVMKWLRLDAERPVVGLLPGSRTNEIKRLLPVMLATAEQLAKRFPGIQFVLLQADSVSDEALDTHRQGSRQPVKVVKGETYDVLQCCNAVITTSGTATLEIALIGVPMAIVYRLAPLTYLIGRMLIRVPYIGLPNIVAGHRIVQEFIQHEARPERIAPEIERILTDHDYADSSRQALSMVKEKLGTGGGSERMAELALEMLTNS
jgi:lipid-A-disaccharide synthase